MPENCTNRRYSIADAALYTGESINSLDKQQTFITRVLMTMKLAKQALLALEPEQLSVIGNGYSGCWIDSDYGKVNQRRLLVHSTQATKRERITFFNNLEKTIAKEMQALGKLSKKTFACGTDAELAFKEFRDQCHLLDFELATIVKVPTYSYPGRPKKNEESKWNKYFIEALLFTDLDKIKLAKLKVGMCLSSRQMTLTAKT